MSWGILDMLGSVATLVFATPLALAGGELVLGGNLLIGVSLVGVALAMIVVDRYVRTPEDLPAMVAEKLAAVVVRNPDEE